MPANLPREWYILEEKFRNEKDLEKKIELLRELIGITPKHKGTENLLAELRRRLAKLEEMLEKRSRKTGKKIKLIEKSGDILVSILGFTQVGKSTLLKLLTNANVEIGDNPYTTKEPVTGVCFYKGVYIQFVEIPSFFLREHLSICHSSDLLILLVRNEDELKEMDKILEANRLKNKPKIVMMKSINNSVLFENIEANKELSELLDGILKQANIVRVFMKPPGKEVEKRAVVLKEGATIKDLIEKLNSAWLKTFKFARIFDNTEFSSRRVGLEYKLKDEDIVELHF
ncbi:MAG: TGS domain-containing protein [Candidatus Aenigmarchaeota archaeon]|nr:TGS domain-containing protein [Candidatus Aenigmarchaeota archaeon]